MIPCAFQHHLVRKPRVAITFHVLISRSRFISHVHSSLSHSSHFIIVDYKLASLGHGGVRIESGHHVSRSRSHFTFTFSLLVHVSYSLSEFIIQRSFCFALTCRILTRPLCHDIAPWKARQKHVSPTSKPSPLYHRNIALGAVVVDLTRTKAVSDQLASASGHGEGLNA